MGLLDNFNSPEMAFGMGLLDAAGPSRMPVSFGQALSQGTKSMQEAKRQQMEMERAKQLMAMHDLEMKAAQQKQADALKMREFLASGLNRFVQSPAQQALAGGGGPTPENAAKLPQLTPQIDREGMYGAMINSGVPELATSGLSGFAALDDKREAAANRKEEFLARLEAQKQAAAEAQQARLDMFRMQQSGREDLARLGASLRPQPENPNKPPAGYRWKPDGSMEPIPGGPADAKARAEDEKKAAGSSDVDSAIAGLRDAYDRLEQGGGITSTKNGPLANLTAAASSSGGGQVVGRWLGTNNQSARNDIAMSRPALLAAMMKATGMSAKQMDSNAELKMWMATATDPTLDVEANRRALENIERKYIRKESTGASGSWEAPKTPMKGQLVDGYRYRGGDPSNPNSWEKQ